MLQERQARCEAKSAAASSNATRGTTRKRSAQDVPANASKKPRKGTSWPLTCPSAGAEKCRLTTPCPCSPQSTGSAGQAPANKQSKFLGEQGARGDVSLHDADASACVTSPSTAHIAASVAGVYRHSRLGKWVAVLTVKRRQVVPAEEVYHETEEVRTAFSFLSCARSLM